MLGRSAAQPPNYAAGDPAHDADRGYDSDWDREALAEKGFEPCIPGRKNRKQPIAYDDVLYKQRNLVERMFGKLKDRRRIATRYDRCANTFMSAICIAATMIFWLLEPN